GSTNDATGRPCTTWAPSAMEGAVRLKEASTPIGEEFNLIPHTLGGRSGPNTQDASQLLANRDALLRSQNYTGVLAPGVDPFGVQSMEIGGVVRVKNALALRRESQLLRVGLSSQRSFQSRDHCHAARAKRIHESSVHC